METKITKYLMIMSSFLLIGSSICLGQYDDDDYKFPFQNPTDISQDNTKLGDHVDIKDEGSLINRLLVQFGLNTANLEGVPKFINYARAILNLALGLLSMIALVMTIYTFYMMFFSDNEAGIKKAKGNLIGIFIALAIIGVSRLIVSLIFRWYQSNWKSNEKKISEGNITMVSESISNNHFYLTA